MNTASRIRFVLLLVAGLALAGCSGSRLAVSEGPAPATFADCGPGG